MTVPLNQVSAVSGTLHVTTPVSVRPVTGRRQLKTFIDVPWHIYSDDPLWVPPLRLERRLHFSKFNPFFRHGEWQAWIAYRGDQPVGRVSAQVDQLHRQHHGADTGHFGLLECVDDAGVCAALMHSAETWLAARQTRHISGPFNLSINQECGILVDGFDTAPVVMMPHARPWYGRLLEEQGYRPLKDLFAYWVKVDFEAPRMMRALIAKFSGKVRLRALRRKKFAEEMETLRDIFNDAWSDNWGFVPFTHAEFEETAKVLSLLLPEDFIQIAEIGGHPVAFIAAFPNVNELIGDLRGRLLPFGWAKLLWRIKVRGARSARVALMGVRKEYQYSRLGPTLAFLVIDAVRKAMVQRRVSSVEMGWVLEDNDGMRHIIEAIGSTIYKRYRVYQKPL